jgi:hypothetical protein
MKYEEQTFGQGHVEFFVSQSPQIFFVFNLVETVIGVMSTNFMELLGLP